MGSEMCIRDSTRAVTYLVHLRGARWRLIALDAAIAVASGLSSFLTYDDANPTRAALAILASAALLLRRKLPWVTLVLTVPGFVLNVALFSTMVALYSVARRDWRLPLTISASAVLFTVQTVELALKSSFWPLWGNLLTWYNSSLYSALYVVAPAALGIAVRIGADLRTEIARVRQLQQTQSKLAAEQALERERAVLAREMHDVVSNQVSLIAVQAGALQIASSDMTAKDVAGTIRSLSVATLDELRAMIEVLRAAGGLDRGPMPQPTLEDLPALLANLSLIHI